MREKIRDGIAVLFVALACSLALCAFLRWLEGVSFGNESAAAVETAIDELAVIEHDRAGALARIILELSHARGFDPLLIVAKIMVESSFSLAVEEGGVRGRLGEVGLMQVHGVALRFAPDGCQLEGDARCQIATGVRFLDFVRDQCPGSPWRWVAAYGMSRCPSEEAARRDPATRRAFAYYRQIGGEGWSE